QPRYGIAPFLILLVLLASFGMQELVERNLRGLSRRWLALLASSAIVLCVPWLLNARHIELWHWNYDGTLPSMAINFAAARSVLIVIALLSLGLALQEYLRLPGKWSIAVLILILSLVSEGSAARIALSKQLPFQYPVVEPLPWLMERDDRILAMGRHFFLSNTNAVYGIRDLRLQG